jgi:16S rRNA (cytidine1402-2'-O)-methyltransferase
VRAFKYDRKQANAPGEWSRFRADVVGYSGTDVIAPWQICGLDQYTGENICSTTKEALNVGTLYVVATPIGNLDDMTPRAVQTLRDVDLIAAEDTRHSGTLLKAFDITTPMISYHHHNRREREARLLNELANGDVALITDAGTPGIADPGHELVGAALGAGHRVVPIPGASSAIAAVSASGLVPGPFLFLGFLPRSGEERRVAIARAVMSGYPFVIFESPVRTGRTLRDLHEAAGDRAVLLARELTKLHEEVRTGALGEFAEEYADVEPRGEVVLVVGGDDERSVVESDLPALIRRLLNEGHKPSKVARDVASITGISGSEAYDLVRQASATSERPGKA